MVTDFGPALALGIEPANKARIMDKEKRPVKEELFTRETLGKVKDNTI